MAQTKTSKLAILSLVLSLLPFMMFFGILVAPPSIWELFDTGRGLASAFALASIIIIFFFLVSVLSLIFGILALIRMNKDKNLTGKGMAVVGVILSSITSLFLMSQITTFF